MGSCVAFNHGPLRPLESMLQKTIRVATESSVCQKKAGESSVSKATALFHGIGHLVADYCKFGGLKLKDKLVASIAGDGRDIDAYTFENIIFINGILPPTSMSGRMEIINTLNCTLEGTNKKIESSSFEMRRGHLFMSVIIRGR